MIEVGKKSVKLALGRQILSFSLPRGEPTPTAQFDGRVFKTDCCDLSIELYIEFEKDSVAVRKRLGAREHVFGLGTRAYPPDRRRGRFVLWNNDVYAYQLGIDPLYASIPILVFIERGRAFALVINSPAYGEVDVGFMRYNEVYV
ncbi:MAG: glycoside hydrolase family 31 protein, partial [Pyrobaculum sp.]